MFLLLQFDTLLNFDLDGVPIRLMVRRDANPFAGRKRTEERAAQRLTRVRPSAEGRVARSRSFAAIAEGCGSVSGFSPGMAWARMAVRVAPGATIAR